MIGSCFVCEKGETMPNAAKRVPLLQASGATSREHCPDRSFAENRCIRRPRTFFVRAAYRLVLGIAHPAPFVLAVLLIIGSEYWILGSGAGRAAAAPPGPGLPVEQVFAPPPQASQINPSSDWEPIRILRLPSVDENPQPPLIRPAEPTPLDRPLPINLATALCLSNARPLTIAFAQASVEEAAAQLERAQVLWLPDLNVGTDYYRHEGTDQSTDGTIILDNKTAFAAGGGATLSLGLTDAIFRPLAQQQYLAAREADLQTARNDALFAVAAAYFDVQQARGTLAGTLDSVAKGKVLVETTTGLARLLTSEFEIDRARATVARPRTAGGCRSGELADQQCPVDPPAPPEPERGSRAHRAAALAGVAVLAGRSGRRIGAGCPAHPAGVGRREARW